MTDAGAAAPPCSDHRIPHIRVRRGEPIRLHLGFDPGVVNVNGVKLRGSRTLRRRVPRGGPTTLLRGQARATRATWRACVSADAFESGAERLPRLQHAFVEIAVLSHALEDDLHREGGRIELLVHLVPA
jgi:hypothetical protein